MADIKKLLRKKGWTGKELGQIELSNMCYQFDQQLHGKTPTPLVSREEMDKMLQTINTNQAQIDAYNTYILIHRWTNVIYNIASAQEQQIQSNIKTLFNYIHVSHALEEAYSFTTKLPVIMTEKQYNDFVVKREDEICHLDSNKMNYNSLWGMFIEALAELSRKLENDPSKDNPLKALKPQLEKEKVTSQIIFDRFNDAFNNGYEVIDETGERSDQMTDEDWEKAIAAPELPESQRTQYGKVLSSSASCDFEIAKAMFYGASEEDIQEIKDKYNPQKHTTWHNYDNPPDDLTKWDIVSASAYSLINLYPSSIGDDKEELFSETRKKATLEEASAFKEEFPTVFKAVTEDMRKYLGDVVDAPIEQWADIVYSWEEIHKMQYYGFNDTFFSDTGIFDGNKKGLFNGVAILKEGTFNKHQIDDRGYYKAPNIFDSFSVLSIDSLFSDSPHYADNAEEVEISRERMLESYYFLLGYNKAIDLVADYFDVPALSVLKLQSKLYEKKLLGLDAMVVMLYREIADNDYEDKELQKKKLKVLKDFFPPIECEKIQIPQECIDAAIEAFKDSRVFEGSELTELLCLRH